jgi:hypothetical protein
MSSVCYKWNDTPFKWSEAPFTWREGCIIDKIVSGAGGNQSIVKHRLKKLDNDEKQILIGLFLRLEVDEIVFETRANKNKNTKVKIKLKDIEITTKPQKNIKVDVKFNED